MSLLGSLFGYSPSPAPAPNAAQNQAAGLAQGLTPQAVAGNLAGYGNAIQGTQPYRSQLGAAQNQMAGAQQWTPPVTFAENVPEDELEFVATLKRPSPYLGYGGQGGAGGVAVIALGGGGGGGSGRVAGPQKIPKGSRHDIDCCQRCLMI